jgi:hypothetical protein
VGLADVTIRPVAVHRHLAPSIVLILLQEGSELQRRTPLIHRVPDLRNFDEPIDLPLKSLLLGQVGVVHLAGLYQLLQHLRVVQGDRYKAGVFDGILYHFMHSLVKDNVSHFFANAFRQTKIFLHTREN